MCVCDMQRCLCCFFADGEVSRFLQLSEVFFGHSESFLSISSVLTTHDVVHLANG